MAKRHRSFEVQVAEELSARDPLSFDLGGEEFHCNGALPGAIVLDFVAASEENQAKAAGRMLTFFDHVIVAEDQERWKALLVDPKRVVPMETIAEIVAWLIEEYTGRPTQESDS